MTLTEFKAWLEGFEAGIGDTPDKAQWAEIKARLASVTVFSVGPAVPQMPPILRDWYDPFSPPRPQNHFPLKIS